MWLGQEIQTVSWSPELSQDLSQDLSEQAGERPNLHVVAGALSDDQARVLICQRPPGKHMAGCWEFPGGKRDGDESRFEALVRELREELGLDVEQARPLIRFRHAYPDRLIDLDVWKVERFTGEPRGLEGQALDWVQASELDGSRLLPADRPIVTALTLGSLYAVTGPHADRAEFSRRLLHVIERGAGLIQLRVPGAGADELAALAGIAVGQCHPAGVRLIINGDPDVVCPLALRCGADGIHVPARYRDELTALAPDARCGLLGMSCHDAQEIAHAQQLGADYVVLGPVRSTASHPGEPGLGWERFATLIRHAAIPVFAIGGMAPDMLVQAWQQGAQGIAAIRALWD